MVFWIRGVRIDFFDFFYDLFFDHRLRLLVSQLIRIAIEVEKLGNSVGLGQRGVDVDVTVAAPRREVLVPQFAKRHNLGDGLRVGPLLNGELVTLRLSKDNKMAFALSADEQLALLTGDLHRAERLVRFISVAHALGELVPQLQRVVLRGSDELVCISDLDASDDILVRGLALEISLADDHILVDVRPLPRVRFPLLLFIGRGVSVGSFNHLNF